MNIEQLLYGLSVWGIPALLAITLHEAAHGFAAWRLGDDTAKVMGRVTLNPFRHIDPVGTVLVPLVLLLTSPFLFGWAKPVPVNFLRLRNPRRDMVWVAAAGPGVNIAIATVSLALIHLAVLLPEYAGKWALTNLVNSARINLILAVFNMIPIPPLDGGRVAVGLLPRTLARPLAELERFGLFIIVGLIFLLPMAGQALGLDIDLLRWLVWVPVEHLLDFLAAVTGVR